MRLLIITVVTLSCFVLGASCPGEEAGICTPTEGRCADNQAQVCDARGRWQMVTDCAEVDADRPFSCQRTDTGDHACLPGDGS